MIAKFAYLIDVDEDMAKKTNTAFAKLHVGYEDVSHIPLEFNITIGNQLRQIKIKIVIRMGVPKNPAGISTTDQANLSPVFAVPESMAAPKGKSNALPAEREGVHVRFPGGAIV